MIELRSSRREEVPRLKEIWKLAFGDSDESVDLFFQTYYDPERMLLLCEDGAPMTMLAMLRMDFSNAEGVHSSMSYVYALATHPDARSKGYGRQLLNYADDWARERGCDCICTKPAEAGLFRYFASVGFHECFATRVAELLRQNVPALGERDELRPARPAEYNRLRCASLTGIPHLACADDLVTYQKELSVQERGDIYTLLVDGAAGCAAAEYVDRDTVLVKELIIDPREMPGAVALLAKELPALRYEIRTPAPWTGLKGSYIQPFAMVKWYDKEKESALGGVTNCYMGLAFD